MKSLYKLHKNHTIPDLDSSCVIIKDINELLSNEHLKGNDNLQLSLSFYNLDALKPTFTISNDKTQENTYEIYKSPVKSSFSMVILYKVILEIYY